MGMNMNCMVTQSLQRQLDQVTIQWDEEENIEEMELQILNETT
jgi:hypothetical protein